MDCFANTAFRLDSNNKTFCSFFRGGGKSVKLLGMLNYLRGRHIFRVVELDPVKRTRIRFIFRRSDPEPGKPHPDPQPRVRWSAILPADLFSGLRIRVVWSDQDPVFRKISDPDIKKRAGPYKSMFLEK